MRMVVRGVGPGAVVRFGTPTGPLVAAWRGTPLPAVGDTVSVELEVVGALSWGVTLGAVDDTATRAAPGAAFGRLEAVDDEVAALRVSDSIVLADLVGEVPAAAVGTLVWLAPDGWEAWPTGV